MKAQYVTNDTGKKIAVILPIKDYEKMMEDLDEMECIKAYDKAKEKKGEFLPAAAIFKSIEQKRKQA